MPLIIQPLDKKPLITYLPTTEVTVPPNNTKGSIDQQFTLPPRQRPPNLNGNRIRLLTTGAKEARCQMQRSITGSYANPGLFKPTFHSKIDSPSLTAHLSLINAYS
ncbi:hypothetical protein JTE90_010453 [Oedothorax gibbosus]|uniref:Uncharacterized protein n=1 Tax=Oedothorax gibbosus TaxID=931172 RepID=A0AAV6W646_9ARAC|nr:hypothetical protein JTE90_010453 [Oedothorax gibbosus]